jgi:hypothetical protein
MFGIELARGKLNGDGLLRDVFYPNIAARRADRSLA